MMEYSNYAGMSEHASERTGASERVSAPSNGPGDKRYYYYYYNYYYYNYYYYYYHYY